MFRVLSNVGRGLNVDNVTGGANVFAGLTKDDFWKCALRIPVRTILMIWKHKRYPLSGIYRPCFDFDRYACTDSPNSATIQKPAPAWNVEAAPRQSHSAPARILAISIAIPLTKLKKP